jgi:periodic tryptophan protein 2
VSSLPPVYLARILRFVAHEAETSPHLELHLRWLAALLSAHGQRLKDDAGAYAAELRAAARAVARIRTELARVAEGNGFLVDYWLGQPPEEAEDGAREKLLLGSRGNGREVEMADGDKDTDDEDEWMGIGDDDA